MLLEKVAPTIPRLRVTGNRDSFIPYLASCARLLSHRVIAQGRQPRMMREDTMRLSLRKGEARPPVAKHWSARLLKLGEPGRQTRFPTIGNEIIWDSGVPCRIDAFCMSQL
jgi:hypothetical protein